jgi:HAE1 family hydrophobic/amphiphilic exporter-1
MNVHLEFFVPPAVSVFVAAGGFSVRVLDKTNSINDERPGRAPETFMDDLLNRKNLASLFNFLASNYPQYELVINNDVAMQNGVSIANAMENLTTVVGGDVQAERKFRSLAEDLSHLFVKNDRGEMVPYSSFMQLKKNQWLIKIDR